MEQRNCEINRKSEHRLQAVLLTNECLLYMMKIYRSIVSKEKKTDLGLVLWLQARVCARGTESHLSPCHKTDQRK